MKEYVNLAMINNFANIVMGTSKIIVFNVEKAIYFTIFLVFLNVLKKHFKILASV
jgi:hypothetical protein